MTVFGMSFGELLLVLVVAVVVFGPKELPRYLRKAGELAGKLRRFAFEMRHKSGIDELLRTEGLDRDIAEIRRLASFARGQVDGVVSAVRSAGTAAMSTNAAAPTAPLAPAIVVEREREFPREGADAYGALADTAIPYDEALPRSPLADDPLYARGER